MMDSQQVERDRRVEYDPFEGSSPGDDGDHGSDHISVSLEDTRGLLTLPPSLLRGPVRPYYRTLPTLAFWILTWRCLNRRGRCNGVSLRLWRFSAIVVAWLLPSRSLQPFTSSGPAPAFADSVRCFPFFFVTADSIISQCIAAEDPFVSSKASTLGAIFDPFVRQMKDLAVLMLVALPSLDRGQARSLLSAGICAFGSALWGRLFQSYAFSGRAGAGQLWMSAFKLIECSWIAWSMFDPRFDHVDPPLAASLLPFDLSSHVDGALLGPLLCAMPRDPVVGPIPRCWFVVVVVYLQSTRVCQFQKPPN
ncbi:hypothetical protein Cni_G15917 [Canna indica]|uniref:Uncharacterized protein n=1 Tax=Canna indica TaxID=4628 RepID=A0AAQ3KE99_9LILI|nr:hypothetical protein Cni_G15917 [Canna indica]